MADDWISFWDTVTVIYKENKEGELVPAGNYKIKQLEQLPVMNFIKSKWSFATNSRKTVITYGTVLLKWFNYLNTINVKYELAGVKELTNFLLSLKNHSTQATYVAIIKSYYRYLIDNDMIKSSKIVFYRSVKTPEISKITEDDIPTEEEIVKLLKACDNYDDKKLREELKTIILLLVSSGARINEVLTLAINDLELKEHRTKKIKRKRGFSGILVFSAIATEQLQTFIEETKAEEKIFTLDPVKFWRILKKLALTAKITKNIHPHVFRHAWATKSQREKLDVLLRQELGGWTSERMLKRYSHQTMKEKLEEYERVYG